MPTYAALVDVNESAFQNTQEMASVWGDIKLDIEDLDGELYDAYAILGEYDFLLLYEAADREAAFQMAVAVERYGFDMETMETIPIEEMGSLVAEI
ncbi:GYD domain-containing protein [Halobacteriaceae archaeon GCM10025711]